MLKYKKAIEEDIVNQPVIENIPISEVYKRLDEDCYNYRNIPVSYQQQYSVVMYAANACIAQLQNKLKNPEASIKMFLYIIGEYSPYKLSLKKENGSFSIVDNTNAHKPRISYIKVKVKTLNHKSYRKDKVA